AAIAGAVIKVSGYSNKVVTDDKGNAQITLNQAVRHSITASAKGFAVKQINYEPSQGTELNLMLEPESLAAQITVAAERSSQRIADAPATVTLLNNAEVTESGAQAIDDVLRSVPGFTLFRRTSSRFSNPTSQGVSLRGVGPSGASRTEVLFNGFPLNDPFGGWVYWDRIPKTSIDHIEVVQGAESNLYGTDALGGVISIDPRRADNTVIDTTFSYGNLRTPDFSFFGSTVFHKWELSLASAAFRTDGYILTAPKSRGPVDIPANSSFQTLSLTIGRQIASNGHIFGYGEFFRENRNNGTPIQTNDTGMNTFALGADWQDPANNNWHVLTYGSSELFHQNFSSVNATRTSETLTRYQRSPSQQLGVSIQWQRSFASKVLATAGIDGRQVRGLSDETAFATGKATAETFTGGRQRIIGAYGQTIFQFTDRLSLTAGIRYDHWRNFDAQSITQPLLTLSPTTITNFGIHNENAFSPKVALVYHPASGFTLHLAGYRAFREPTLNELYRSFRVGNVITLQDPNLLAERLTGAEGGLAFYNKSGKLAVRGTAFWNEIVNPVANLTLSVTPSLITRERANLGRTTSSGIELDSEWRATSRLTFNAGYQFDNAKVARFPVDRTLEGLFIPQVPRHQFTLQSRYTSNILTASAQGRFSSKQFDDDQNQFPLDSFFVVDAYVSHPITRQFDLFAAGE